MRTRRRLLAAVAGVALALALSLGAVRIAGALPPTPPVSPPRLRICCALGHDLSLNVAGLALPVAIENVVSAEGLGRHRYSAGAVFDERNGLVHTCRGGFVDVAHVRSVADRTAWLYVRGLPLLGRGASITLSSDDGDYRLNFPVRDAGPDPEDRMRRIAARAAWELSIWHELVTWVGRRTVTVFPEGFSAFSPEDLYSDLLGAEVGARALASPKPWDEAVDDALREALVWLEARGLAETRAALDAVEGEWWDRRVPVPRSELLLVRSFDAGPVLVPWQVSAGCEGRALEPLEVPERDASGVRLDELYTLELVTPPEALAKTSTRAIASHELPALVAELARVGEGVDAGDENGLADERAEGRVERERERLARIEESEEELEGAGIRLFPLEIAGGLARTDDAGPREGLGGFELRGGFADTAGGALSAVRFATMFLGARDVLATRFIGIEARGLFACRERDTHALVMPVAAWFQDCEHGGALGLDGMLAAVQLDGASGRMVLRPIELALALDVARTAFSPGFFRQRLVAFLGASADAYSVEDGPHGVTVHAHGGLRGQLRTPSLALGLEGYASYRIGLDEDDFAVETGLRADYRHVVRRNDGLPLATLRLGLEGGWSRWGLPHTSMATFVLPVISATDRDTLHALVTLQLAFDRLGF